MKALIIVDVQNDFVDGGTLAVPGGTEIVPVINALQANGHYDYVVATQDLHPANHGSFADNHEGKLPGETVNLSGLDQILWPTHCVAKTAGADFVDDLHQDNWDAIFPKGTDARIDSYSGFFDNGKLKATGLGKYLKENGVNEVHVVGLATDYCVKFTALDAAELGFQTILIQDACRGVNLQDGDVARAITQMKENGVRIVDTGMLLKGAVV
ncbi:MAG: bifunctional nicotinamidase/pyrazinamidase [Verrucomicrobiota bacterium]